MKRWTEAEDKLLREKYPSSTEAELCEILPGRSSASIACRASGFGLAKSEKYMAKVNGQRASRLTGPPPRPIGSTHRKGRYTLIKIGMPDEWEPLHIHVWKKHHGEVPDGMKVCAIDGNPSNAVIENLVLRTFAEHQVKTHHHYKDLPEEIVEILHLQNEIKKAVRGKRRNEK